MRIESELRAIAYWENVVRPQIVQYGRGSAAPKSRQLTLAELEKLPGPLPPLSDTLKASLGLPIKAADAA